MKIAVEGCAHGELDKIYECIETLQARENIKIDLLICCGDFQSVRNRTDLKAMAVPEKYQFMCTFYKYYSGEKKAPILTLFIGGNHEASNYLQELPYGGWVAPNIYYLGRAGVVNFGDLRIGGLSGIYKGHDYLQGLWESVPYTQHSLRSVYHVRSLDVFRLSQLQDKVHVMLSHDWPRGITNYGDVDNLLRRKQFLREDIESNQLGSMPAERLLHQLKPDYWFSAHLHCQFAALVQHDDGSETKFLALDKCLPKRSHLQILDLPSEFDGDKLLKYDIEWLAILKSTNHLLSVKNIDCHMPGPGVNERYQFTPTTEEKEAILSTLKSAIIDESNFVRTAPVFEHNSPKTPPTDPILNPQTVNLCELLGIDDPVQVVIARAGRTMKQPANFSSVSKSDTELKEKISVSPELEPQLEIPTTPKVMSKLSLPEPLTPSESKHENESTKEFLTPHNSIINDSLNTSDDFTTPVSASKKTFKRRNVSIYNSSDQDESESTTSTILEGDSPCKMPFRQNTV